MNDLKSNRQRLTLYLDQRHLDWFRDQPNNSRSDLFNLILDDYRKNIDGTGDRVKQKAFFSTTSKMVGNMSERVFIRFTKAQTECINKVSQKLNMRHTDYIRECVWSYTTSMMKKHNIKIKGD